MLLWVMFAVCIVATLYVTCSRVLPMRLIFGYATYVDVLFTVGLFVLFHGSITGLMAATLAGLMLAVSLSVGRWSVGYQRFVLRRSTNGIAVELQTVPGKLQELVQRISEWTTRVMTGLTARFISFGNKVG